jgi:hypothetical protein
MWAGQRNVKRDPLLSRRHWSSRPHSPPCGSRSGRGPGVRRRAIGPNRAPASVESSSPAAAIAFHARGQRSKAPGPAFRKPIALRDTAPGLRPDAGVPKRSRRLSLRTTCKRAAGRAPTTAIAEGSGRKTPGGWDASWCRVGRAHRCARPPSEPDVHVSAHLAQASPVGSVARRRTIHSTWSRSSAGPFATTVVAASNLSVGSGVIVIFSCWAHLTASARFRVRAPGPVSGRLSGTASWRG